MSTRRIYAFDAIKFLAAVCILFHHYQAVLNVQFDGFNFYGGQFYFGHIVELFFVISGFLSFSAIAKVSESETLSSFFTKRCIRLLPINILAATAHIFVIYLSYHGFHLWGWLTSSFGLFAVDPSFAAYGVNPPCWYVSVLLICYVFFYLLTALAKRKAIPLPWLYAAMVLLGLLIQLNGCNQPLLNSFAGRGYFAFFTGLLTAFLHQRCGSSPKLQLIAGCTLVVFWGLYFVDPFLVSEGLSYLLTLLVYPSLVILSSSGLCQKIFCRRWLPLLGEVSFGMYLLHTPVLYLLLHIHSQNPQALPIGSRSFMLAVTAAIILLSFGSLYVFERPVSKKLSALFQKSQEADQP